MACPSCGHANPPESRFCRRCGGVLAHACPSCGQDLAADDAFCFRCGGSLAAVAATTSPSASAPPPVLSASPAASTPESFANGRYAVRRFLGEGGKKRVYLVHDTKLDREVAFSLIKTEGLDTIGVERIVREQTGQAPRELREDVRSTLRDLQSLEEHATFLSSKIQFLLDATLGLVNLEQNNIIKIFSVAAVAKVEIRQVLVEEASLRTRDVGNHQQQQMTIGRYWGVKDMRHVQSNQYRQS